MNARTDLQQSSMRPGLQVRAITVTFGGITALSDVSFDAPTGEVTGLIGPNGAGKTTMFNVLCGYVKPAAGELFWQGEAIRPRPDRLASGGVARTLQGVGLFPGMSVLENVQLGADHFRRGGLFSGMVHAPWTTRSERDLRDRAMSALAHLKVDHIADAAPGELPYPLQKRVSIARALASEPKLLLLDEPAGGLGHGDIEELRDIILELVSERQTTVVLVEHHMDFVMRTCTNIAVLNFGQLLATGTPQEIGANQAVLDAYLGTDAEEAS